MPRGRLSVGWTCWKAGSSLPGARIGRPTTKPSALVCQHGSEQHGAEKKDLRGFRRLRIQAGVRHNLYSRRVPTEETAPDGRGADEDLAVEVREDALDRTTVNL